MAETNFQKAKRYYYYACISILESREVEFLTLSEIISYFYNDYIDGSIPADAWEFHQNMIARTVIELQHNSIVNIIKDDFTESFISLSDGNYYSSLEKDPIFDELLQKIAQLGDSSKKLLISAFARIPDAFHYDIPEEDIIVEPIEVSTDPDLGWSPLKLDRDSAKYKEAIDATEAALREIESSNGYAATDLEEKNAIAATIKGNLEAIKNGAPSKGSILNGLVSPLQYISKKFTDATLGEIAKLLYQS